MQSQESGGNTAGASGPQLVLTLAAQRAPAVLVAELVDVVGRRCCDAGEVLIGVDETTGRLGLFVAGVVVIRPAAAPVAVPVVPANGNGHHKQRASKRRPTQPVGAGVLPTSWVPVLEALQQAGGEINDAGGRATRVLATAMDLGVQPRTLAGLATLLKSMESHHYLSRDNRGKRTSTFTIRLEPAGLAILDDRTVSPGADVPTNHRGGSGAVVDLPAPMNTPAPGRDDKLQHQLRHAAAAAL